jgi:hypothetical protein
LEVTRRGGCLQTLELNGQGTVDLVARILAGAVSFEHTPAPCARQRARTASTLDAMAGVIKNVLVGVLAITVLSVVSSPGLVIDDDAMQVVDVVADLSCVLPPSMAVARPLFGGIVGLTRQRPAFIIRPRRFLCEVRAGPNGSRHRQCSWGGWT